MAYLVPSEFVTKMVDAEATGNSAAPTIGTPVETLDRHRKGPRRAPEWLPPYRARITVSAAST